MAGSQRGSVSATHKSDRGRCCRSLEEVHATDGSGSCISHSEERVSYPAALPSTGKAGEGTCAGGVSRLCTPGDTQASAEAEGLSVFPTATTKPTVRHPYSTPPTSHHPTP